MSEVSFKEIVMSPNGSQKTKFPHIQLSELKRDATLGELTLKISSLETKMDKVLDFITRAKQINDILEPAESPMSRQLSNQSNSIIISQNSRRESIYGYHVAKSPSYHGLVPENVRQDVTNAKRQNLAEAAESESMDLRTFIRWYLHYGMGSFGKTIECFILLLILLSVILYILSTYDIEYRSAEYGITFVFTLEYLLRIYAVKNRIKFVVSIFGLIDLVSIVPTYLALFLGSSEQTFLYIRAIRSIRAFRFFRYMEKDADSPVPSPILDELGVEQFLETKFCCFTFSLLHVQMAKSTVTMFLILFVFSGIFFSLEGPDSDFVDEPTTETFFETFYFMIVSVSTVGYGEIHPMSWAGQLCMIIAIPTSLIMLPLQYRVIGDSYELIEKTRERQWREKRHKRKEQNSYLMTPRSTMKRSLFE